MRPFYNTPQPINLDSYTKPELSGNALLIKLEDDFTDYREGAAKGYFRSDPNVVLDFKSKIKNALESIENSPSSNS